MEQDSGGGGPGREPQAGSADLAESSHIRATGLTVGAWRLSRKLLAEGAELGVPAGPGRLVGVGSLEGLVVAGGAGVPGGADSPVVGVTTPVGLRGHVQAERLGGGLPRAPEVVWSVTDGSVDITGQRWLPVVTVSGGVGRTARVGKGGVETLWTWRLGGRTGAGSGSWEGGGGGGGRRRSARSPGQSAVTQRDAVEALT